MDDSLRMGVRDGAGRVAHQGRDSAGLGAAQLLEVAPFDELHGDVVLSVHLAEIVDGRDVRMGEGRRDMRFATEPRNVPILPHLEHLERDPAAEGRVPRLPHLAHAALAEEQDAPVAAELGRLARLGRELRDGIIARQGARAGGEVLDRGGAASAFRQGEASHAPRARSGEVLREEVGGNDVPAGTAADQVFFHAFPMYSWREISGEFDQFLPKRSRSSSSTSDSDSTVSRRISRMISWRRRRAS